MEKMIKTDVIFASIRTPKILNLKVFAFLSNAKIVIFIPKTQEFVWFL